MVPSRNSAERIEDGVETLLRIAALPMSQQCGVAVAR